MSTINSVDLVQLANDIKAWGRKLGFQQVGISDIDLSKHEAALQAWLDNGYHGNMAYMESHGMKRARPNELVPGTLRVISVRMDYLPPDASFAANLKNENKGYVSRYAVGRDYHKLIRKRLKKLSEKILEQCSHLESRPFVDSAPVLEHALAEKAGIGWTGKHSLTLNRHAGSWFFLGELFVNLPLPVDSPVEEGCGSCTACMTICPTNAIVAPYKVDARKCISYLTIEFDGIIPEQLRELMGNRIYGCDDCQLICPWNRYASVTEEVDFYPREKLHGRPLIELFEWTEEEFLTNTEGSAIRRIGYQKWLRNIAVAMGNARYDEAIVTSLINKLGDTTELVKHHVEWALLKQAQNRAKTEKENVTSRKTLRLTRAIEKGLPRDA
ncbi:tRNA epoxyqueuosine(34) reductase QueG [Alteromonas sp. ASW11-130]|uniref:tRNA epoxyqueuosine(34) reductase QueG n=1 Tax=Alteromonas sp. ASW11-130 TaxID=3015775 RepID=UPI00224265E9|nr:tRNA epoxyqueuosine(34) reductase QueG [Alteromonas sp. ASW11-130]MCW8090777.1 tRNA epoxyqueuosine(34) reductase QueG [Alteromonas sp. ASW11-130]